MQKLIIALPLVAVFCGCALDRADPAARSARATYGAISIVCSGENSKCTLTIGDGALAAADGNGEVSQPTTMTTTQSPSFALPAGCDPITAGINAISYIAGEGIKAYAGKKNTASQTNGQATNTETCPDGNCGECVGDGCSEAR